MVLRNRIRGYTYWSLRPEWLVLGRRIEISRTRDFYACFFGRERRDWWSLYYSVGGVWWFVVVVVVAVSDGLLKKYFNFFGICLDFPGCEIKMRSLGRG